MDKINYKLEQKLYHIDRNIFEYAIKIDKAEYKKKYKRPECNAFRNCPCWFCHILNSWKEKRNNLQKLYNDLIK